MLHAIRCLFVFLLLVAGLPVVAQERGKASYYARRMQGRKMSSGLRYHNDSMYCAHKKHPFGTLLKVVSRRSGKSVVVKVTDRGPFGRGRIVDLSWRAAKELGMLAAGVIDVDVYVFKPGMNADVPYPSGEAPATEADEEKIQTITDLLEQQPKFEMLPISPASKEKAASHAPAAVGIIRRPAR